MSIADDLLRLHELHQRGGLTEAEFALAKARVLGERALPQPDRFLAMPGDGRAARAAASGARSAPQPNGARALVIFLLIVIALLAAPIAWRAFENWVFDQAASQWRLSEN